MKMNSTVIGCVIIGIFVILLISSLVYDVISRKRDLRAFQPGYIVEYYDSYRHGKFRQRELTASYEILDVDGMYAMYKSLKTGREFENNLTLDLKYSDMVIKTKDGEIIKEFNKDK